MDETYHWATMRSHAVEAFNGELPNAHVEAEIIAVFETAPRIVTRAIDDVAEQFQAGKIRSGWAVLRKKLETATSTSHATATDSSERETKVANAERWIRNTGIHVDRDTELLDELFGPYGILRAYADDDVLRRRMTSLWREQRPRGQQVEAEAKHVA